MINGENNTPAIQLTRRHFERETAMKFDTDRIITVQVVRIVLRRLGYDSEIIADYEITNLSEFSKLVLALQKFRKYMSKAGMAKADIYEIVDKYRVGGDIYNAAVGK